MKQTIVMRKDLNMRKGKMIAQGAHASVANVLRILEAKEKGNVNKKHLDDLEKWLKDSFRKITLYVNSEDELINIYNMAKESQLNVSLIEDNGDTEFKGIKTKTCLAIGPHNNEDIDKITYNLKLL